MSNYTPTSLAPNWAGEFSSYQQWVNKGRSWLASPDHRRAVCIDDKGRRVTCGGDFALARDEGAFPVRFFWDCEPQAIATPFPANGAEGLPAAWISPRLLQSLASYREVAKVPSNWSVAVQAAQRNPEDLGLFTAEQLRASVLAERSACAEACMRASPNRAKVKAIGESAHYVACADAIRARK